MIETMKVAKGERGKYILVVPRIDSGGPFEPRQYATICVDGITVNRNDKGEPQDITGYKDNYGSSGYNSTNVITFPASLPYMLLENDLVSWESAEESLRAEKEWRDKARSILGEAEEHHAAPSAPGGQYL